MRNFILRPALEKCMIMPGTEDKIERCRLIKLGVGKHKIRRNLPLGGAHIMCWQIPNQIVHNQEISIQLILARSGGNLRTHRFPHRGGRVTRTDERYVDRIKFQR